MISDLFSMLLSSDAATIFLFFVVAYLTWKFFHDRGLPPGPRGLPIVGYMPFMGRKPTEETFVDLSRRYGPVISLYFGSTLFVVLNSYEAIKEALVKQGTIFHGRPLDISTLKDSDKGVASSEGEIWKEHRRFILSTFRDYGMGKLSLEPRIWEEIHFFLEALAAKKEQPINVFDLLAMSTQNIISTLEFGRRFDYNDENFVRLRKLQNELFENFPLFPVSFIFPFINYLPFTEFITHKKALDKGFDALVAFLKGFVDEHKAEYQENSRKDLIDAYITERKLMIEKIGNEGFFTEEEINVSLVTLFSAGSETTASILRWTFLMLIIHPDIQKKVHEEIDRVIGQERIPSMNDRNQMPYCEAVILETLRFASINPLNLPHSNIEETELYGYRIPKRSMILTNLWAVHFNPRLWDTPELFKPERFINEDGKVHNSEHVLAFGIGKRACLGESLARVEAFLYFVGTLQRFNLTPPPGTTPKLEVESTNGRRPLPYKLCFLQRPGYSAS